MVLQNQSLGMKVVHLVRALRYGLIALQKPLDNLRVALSGQ